MGQFVIPKSVSDEESSKIPRYARNDWFELDHYQRHELFNYVQDSRFFAII